MKYLLPKFTNDPLQPYKNVWLEVNATRESCPQDKQPDAFLHRSYSL